MTPEVSIKENELRRSAQSSIRLMVLFFPPEFVFGMDAVIDDVNAFIRLLFLSIRGSNEKRG